MTILIITSLVITRNHLLVSFWACTPGSFAGMIDLDRLNPLALAAMSAATEAQPGSRVCRDWVNELQGPGFTLQFL